MNPFFSAMGGSRQPNMMQQFQQFMQQMKGKDPNAMIQEMVSSGHISQDQLNQVQKQAQQMQEEAERSGRALVEQTRRALQQLETQRRRQAAEDAEAARQQALREVQADCDALRQRAGAKMPQAVDNILRRVVQE